jgi:hypothetical protein
MSAQFSSLLLKKRKGFPVIVENNLFYKKRSGKFPTTVESGGIRIRRQNTKAK